MTEQTAHLLEGLNANARNRIIELGVLNNPDAVIRLEELTQQSRWRILHQVGSLGVDLDEAIRFGEKADSSEGIPAEVSESSRIVERRRVDSLRASPVNEALFDESLADASIQQLAETMSVQRVPIEITLDGEIVDGQRRWKAAQKLGWEEVDVVVLGELGPEEVKDRILDAYSSIRDASLAEKARLFDAYKEQLQRRYGRPQGRPVGKTISDEILLSAEEICDAAARKAGLRSAGTAKRMDAIFKSESEEVRERLLAGELSISRAYELLPKRKKSFRAPRPKASESLEVHQHTPSDWNGEKKGDVEEVAPSIEAASPTPPLKKASSGEHLAGLEAPPAPREAPEAPTHPFDESSEEVSNEPDSTESESWAVDLLGEIAEVLDCDRVDGALLEYVVDCKERLEAARGTPECEDLLGAVPAAVTELRDSVGFEEARGRCEALVESIWEALGEAPEDDDEDESIEDDDEEVYDFLELA